VKCERPTEETPSFKIVLPTEISSGGISSMVSRMSTIFILASEIDATFS